MGVRPNKNRCFVETHINGINATFRCDGSSVPLFEDFTDNHNKILLTVNATCPDNNITIFFETDENEFNREITDSQEHSFLVENLRNISFSCTGQSDSCRIFFIIQVTFCICCNPLEN